MFTPSLTKDQRRQAADIRTRLAAALEPVAIQENPKLAPLVEKREELTQEIGNIERGAGGGSLEESGALLANRRAQLHLVGLQITELQSARAKTEETAQKESAETLASLMAEARGLLIQLATSFQSQHKEAITAAITQYATRHSAEAGNLVRMIPWFLTYLKRIRAFRDGYTDPARLLEFLGAALECQDFLMPKS